MHACVEFASKLVAGRYRRESVAFYIYIYKMFQLFTKKNISKNFTNVLYCHRKVSILEPENKKSKVCEESLTLDESILCNKSRLLNQHRQMLYKKPQYPEPQSWIHLTEKYQRKVFARCGSASGVNPRVCFHAKSDKIGINRYKEYAESDTLHAMINEYKAEQKAKMDEIVKRDKEICKNIEKLNQWKKELNLKIQKKEADAIAAKERKDRLVEQVRRHFGYKVDPRDERFKEVLEQMEKQDKKKQKEEKRKAKEQQLMLKLVESSKN